jgi:uncharacterized protein involved in exopolysaccharide biosynthesis
VSSEQTAWERASDADSGGQIPPFLLDPIGVTKRRRLPMAICLAVGLALTIAAVVAWKPAYLAKATLLITSQQIPSDFVRSTVQADSLANINAMIGEVLSAENLSKLIDRHNLFPNRKPDTKRIDLVNSMRARISGNPQRSQSDRTQSIVYEISYTARDPVEASTVANSLAGLFVEASVARRNTQARRTTEFLRGALERSEVELRKQSKKISEFRQAHRGELPDEQESSLRRLELLSTQRDSLSEQIASKEDRLLLVSSRSSGATESEKLANDMRRQLASEIAIHTDDHPNVIALRDRLARLEEANRNLPLPAAAGEMLAAERREIARMREQRARVEAELVDLNQRVDRIPIIAEELTALEQKESVMREDYTAALRKVEQAELAENLESAQQGGQVSILDEAAVPSSPTRSRSLLLLAGVLLSGGFALAIALLLEFVDPVLIDARQVENLSGKPVLGSVPHVA